MSLFKPITLGCPACGTAVEFQAVHSVNADARPDLRTQILADTFQQQTCSKCGKTFRLDPEFNLIDTQRGEWIAAAPLGKLTQWKALEDHAKAVFERAFGEDAAEGAQKIGKKLRPRITFGWPALREKLVAIDNDLDDVTLELCKAFILRSVDSPVAADTELRLLSASPAELAFGWLRPADESPGPSMRVARSLYDQIAADADGAWEDLRDELSAGLFVDVNRLLMAESVDESAARAGEPSATETQDQDEAEDGPENPPAITESKPAKESKKASPKKSAAATKATPSKKKKKK
jgi:CpXC motif protein